jgi:diguanylate cyclase (GGDEF)-like protein
MSFFTGIFIITIAFLVLTILVTFKNTNISKSKKMAIMACALIIALAQFCDWSSYILQINAKSRILHLIAKTLEFSITPLCPLALSYAVIKSKSHKYMLIPIVIHFILEILNIFFGFIFTIDIANQFVRESFYWIFVLSYMSVGLYMFIMTYLLTIKTQNQNLETIIAVVLFIAGGVIIEMFNKDIRISFLTLSMSLAIYCIYYQDIIGQTDFITGLLNRRTFDNHLELINKKFALIVFDIDDFKDLNKTYGKSYGDLCKKEIAEVLLNTYHRYGKCYIYGEDEFAVIFSRHLNQFEDINKNFIKNLSDAKFIDSLLPSVSLGYSFLDDYKDKEDMLLESEYMLKEAKEKK